MRRDTKTADAVSPLQCSGSKEHNCNQAGAYVSYEACLWCSDDPKVQAKRRIFFCSSKKIAKANKKQGVFAYIQ
jgi:hypothetical protein